jgi:hypothetical protein
MQRPIGAHLAEGRCFANPQRAFDATSLRLQVAGGPRTAGLEMPVALAYRAEWVGPAAKGRVRSFHGHEQPHVSVHKG